MSSTIVHDEAFVSLVTNNSYGNGALVLGYSLRRVNTTRQLALLISRGVSDAMRRKLSQVWDHIADVDILDSQDAANLALLTRPELGITFTKIHCWTLTQYRKCVFLDADTLVLKNCDELFERRELSAVPDIGWPDCFNSGVFVFEPSTETYQALLQHAVQNGSFDGGDQGLLNSFFNSWPTSDISHLLSFIYNMNSNASYSYAPAFKQFGNDVKIVHFLGPMKPWHYAYNDAAGTVYLPSCQGNVPHVLQFLQLWWDIHNSPMYTDRQVSRSDVDQVTENMSHAYLGDTHQESTQVTTAEQESTEQRMDRQHRESWLHGRIDYMGRDKFENIQQRMESFVNGFRGVTDVPQLM